MSRLDGGRLARGDGAPIRVLHVDDDPQFADLCAQFLERADERFEVLTASSAPAGLERLEGVDCVVSDYEMPAVNGIEFLHRVRERDPDLPFILFTGRGSEAVASDAIAAGVTDYLQKESGTDQYAVLANRIANAVEQTRSQSALEASQERLSLFIDQSPLGVIEWTPEFEVVRINDAAEEILGYTERDLRGDSWERIVPDSAVGDVAEIVDQIQDTSGGYHSINGNVTVDGELIVCEWHNRTVTDDDGEVVAVFSQFQDVTDRHERRQVLERLHETTRGLIQADAPEDVAELAVAAARDVLGMEMNGVFLYDEATDALTPAAVTDRVRGVVGDPPRLDRGEGLAWDAFDAGEHRLFDDVSTVEGRYNPDSRIRAEMLLPLGDHGVLFAGSLSPGVYDETDVTLARILAANVDEALSRIDREASLRERRRRYRTLVDNFPDGTVSLYDENLELVLAGGMEMERADQDPDEMVGETLSDAFPDEIVAQQEPHLRAALDGESRTFEQSYDDEWYRISTVPIGDGSDAAMAVSQNVTERKEHLRTLETLVDNLPGMTYRCRNEPGWPMETVRGDVESLTGYTPEELERQDGLWGEEILHPDDREEMWASVQAAIDVDDSFEVTYRIRTRDGETRWMWERGRAVTDDEDDVLRLEGFITDVTDRKTAEDRLEAFIDCASDVLGVIDENGIFRELSPSIQRVTGHEPSALLGEPVMEYVHPDDRDEVIESFQEMVRADGADTSVVRYRFRHAAGSWQWLESVGSNRTDTALDGYVVTSRDVTDRIERERELERQNERLDEFATVVSHDLRNPVNVADGYLELLRSEYDDERIAEAQTALDRIERIVDSLLALARGDDGSREPEPIDLSAAAEEAWHTVDTGGATLTVTGDLCLRAETSRLGQVFENCFRNAVEHGADADGTAEAADLSVTVGPLSDGTGFYVADDGVGIDPEVGDRIRDDAYSTGDGGLGLGLTIVERVAADHGWTMDVTESADGGVRVEFRGVETV